MGGIIYKEEEWDPVGTYAYCLQSKSVLHDPIREKSLLNCLYFVIERKSFCIEDISANTRFKL